MRPLKQIIEIIIIVDNVIQNLNVPVKGFATSKSLFDKNKLKKSIGLKFCIKILIRSSCLIQLSLLKKISLIRGVLSLFATSIIKIDFHQEQNISIPKLSLLDRFIVFAASPYKYNLIMRN